jgi:hypothetical protein
MLTFRSRQTLDFLDRLPATEELIDGQALGASVTSRLSLSPYPAQLVNRTTRRCGLLQVAPVSQQCCPECLFLTTVEKSDCCNSVTQLLLTTE